LERFLALFAAARAGEAPVLDQPGGAEIKNRSTAARAVHVVAIVPLYGNVATMLPQRRLIIIDRVTACFMPCLPLPYVLTRVRVRVAVQCFLRTGKFSLTVIAQFWARANNIRTPEEGRRLFAAIAFVALAFAVAIGRECRRRTESVERAA
jgi:AAA family ATP:ADP antiporter